jgi:hypothetical protein
MPLDAHLTTAEIGALFADEVTAAGGTVSETFNDGVRLFTRSVLPHVRPVRTGDPVQAGVALRAGEGGVWVHPYVFRQVCRNGAIIAHALQTRHLEADEFGSPEGARFAVREAVRACCDEETFAHAARAMRSAATQTADVGLNVLTALSRVPPEVGTRIFRMVVERFFTGDDRSQYGLMNAVTSVARDTPDPEIRWGLEEFGGGIAVGRDPVPEPDGTAAAEWEAVPAG